MKAKSLSIVIASYNSGQTLQRCLQSLENQVLQATVAVEVIVVDSYPDGMAARVAARFHWVRLYAFSERMYPGEARNFGIGESTGDLIAFLDADCVVDENWLSEILKSHELDSWAIGGAVDNGNPDSYVGWGYYFGEFTHWSPQTPAGPMIEVPTGSLSIKRPAFERYGPFLEGVYCSDTDFNWKLGRAGHAPLFNPRIKVAHINPTSLSVFLRHEVEHGRAFADLRVKVEKFSQRQSWIYVLGSPLLPFLLFMRAAWRVMTYGIYPGWFLLTIPVTFLGLAAWSIGEAIGYIAHLAAFFRLTNAESPFNEVNS